MALFITALLSISVAMVGVGGTTAATTPSSVHSVIQCHDWGESDDGAVRVMEGEACWLLCPLFSHPTVYNYSSAQAAGLNLVWYHVAAGQDLEQPIDFHHPDQRLSKERERLWLQPTTTQDAGQYICMLRNRTSCAKIAMRLEVLPSGQDPNCEVKAAVPPTPVIAPIQDGRTLTCPDLEHIKLPNTSHSVTWYHGCNAFGNFNIDRVLKGDKLVIHVMLEHYQGLYHCVVTYETKGRAIKFTRVVNVTAVSSSGLPKQPNILNPAKEQLYPVKQGSEVNLTCRVSLPYLEGPRETWWTIDGKTVDQLADPRISFTSRVVLDYFGDWTVENVLRIQDFSSEDLTREYNCSGRNGRDVATRRAVLEEEVYLPSVELGCGLGVTLFLMLVLFVVYHIFWLELLLLYRSWFGTDERCTDDKEYDIYISYARNSEEEQFVLLTLRRVLENELGYTVCIFDRDSLPGGNMSEAVLRCMRSSRRLLVVLSPTYLTEKSVSLLECRLGLYIQLTCHAHIITVLYSPLPRLLASCTEAKQLCRSTATITWRGRQSESSTSRFWKRLRLALPVRPLALGRRLIDSTSSHSDLATSLGQQCQPQDAAEPQRQRDGKSAAGNGVRGRGRKWRIQEARSREMPKAGHGKNCGVCVREPHGVLGRAAVKTQHTHQPTAKSIRPETQPRLHPSSTKTQLGLHSSSTKAQPGLHQISTETETRTSSKQHKDPSGT
ncbi:interleukin-1 receptor accessory protein isoform X1 [Oncorhynchus mykiss]|uniref:interleukin-1 receptor accessory protein isoform X1 n=1 Tax=Oncorhynchus mykiss TaxID=8022 RepID=UPI000B4F3182|nr:interleukin-1 receptor accessory protein isoform X1 [Oncorhynchus mykiss]